MIGWENGADLLTKVCTKPITEIVRQNQCKSKLLSALIASENFSNYMLLFPKFVGPTQTRVRLVDRMCHCWSNRRLAGKWPVMPATTDVTTLRHFLNEAKSRVLICSVFLQSFVTCDRVLCVHCLASHRIDAVALKN